MRLAIREIHQASSQGALNEEWFIVENVGDKPFSTAGCAVAVGGKGGRLKQLGTLDPGFSIAPSERVRVITGNPGKKAHGAPPPSDSALRNYHLFLAAPIFGATGTVVAVSLRQHEVARATFDPAASGGVSA